MTGPEVVYHRGVDKPIEVRLDSGTSLWLDGPGAQALGRQLSLYAIRANADRRHPTPPERSRFPDD